jgi:hypothetical protein
MRLFTNADCYHFVRVMSSVSHFGPTTNYTNFLLTHNHNEREPATIHTYHLTTDDPRRPTIVLRRRCHTSQTRTQLS